MIANYHTHTYRCNHAVGTERAYVENAIEGGLKILGFADHTPMIYDNGYQSHSKMTFGQVEDYVDTVLALKAEYASDIEIHIGFESEYYPKYFDEVNRILSDYPIEYHILGQHFLGNGREEFFCMTPTNQEEYLKRYVDTVIAAFDTGHYIYLAHPDVIGYRGSDQIYERHMRRLCESAKDYDIPLEYNLLGAAEGRHYPDARFWRIAGDVGNKVILGTDAHAPEDVVRPAAEEKAMRTVEKDHLKLIETLNL